MAAPDQTGPDKVKQTLKFGEERRTLWLNLHGKDAYGRHRGYVLYGMDVVPQSGTTVQVKPGAVYTPWGTRIYIEDPVVSANTLVDLSTVPNWNSNAGGNPLPHLIAIVLQLAAFDPKNMASIDTLAEYQVSTSLVAKHVPVGMSDVSPALNLDAVDPVLLGMTGRLPASNYPSLSDYTDADIKPATGATPLSLVEIPIAYVLVGVNPQSDAIPTSLATGSAWNPGISVVQCQNAFSMVADLLGLDPFAGRTGTRVTPNAGTGTAADQVAGQQSSANISTAVAVMQSPKFGTAQPTSTPATEPFNADSDRSVWSGANWLNYRKPSFFRDGENFLWALRRLDYVLRLWLDRTGDQELITWLQDGAGGFYSNRRELQLDAILANFDGANGANNNNVSTFETAGSGSDVLQSGKVVHHISQTAPTVAGVTGGIGDTYRTGLSALNIAFRHLLLDLLGLNISRANLRNTAALTAPFDGGTKTFYDAIIALAGTDFEAKVNRSGDTMTGQLIVPNDGLKVQAASPASTEGGGIILEKPGTGTALTGDVSIDIAINSVRAFAAGSAQQGIFNVNLETGAVNVQTGDNVENRLTFGQNPRSVTEAATDSSTKLATTAFAKTMDSPAFVGTPTAPTASPGTNNTQIATTAFVQNAAAAVPSYLSKTLITGSLVSDLNVNGNFTKQSTAAAALSQSAKVESIEAASNSCGYVRLQNTSPATDYEVHVRDMHGVWSGGLLTALVVDLLELVITVGSGGTFPVLVATPITVTTGAGWVTLANWSGTPSFVARIRVDAAGSDYDIQIGYTGDTGNPGGQFDRYAQIRLKNVQLQTK